mmetsp:Transcript_43566/g.52239  ORF Transcript_43566/g.52239 Transcript_43566/m.52239 type:complete len:742 (-) Transcript_43566:34-2259(-)
MTMNSKNYRMIKSAVPSILVIIGIFTAIPFTFTYFHVKFVRYDNELCSVSVASSSSLTNEITTATTNAQQQQERLLTSSDGIYKRKFSKENKQWENKRADFLQIISSNTSHENEYVVSSFFRRNYVWPSVMQNSIFISNALQKITTKPGKEEGDTTKLVFFTNKWCFVNSSRNKKEEEDDLYCSSEVANDNTEMFPPSGTYTSPSNQSINKILIQVSCSSLKMVDDQSKKGGIAMPQNIREKQRNKKKKGNRNKTLKKLIQTPSTIILVFINTYLAFRYWNDRVSPSNVGKIYNKIVVEKQLWRCFTGAFAHFELLHLGWNMMSLVALGEALENVLYDSIAFLHINLSLVILTSIFMMGVMTVQIRQQQQGQMISGGGAGEGVTVGYSGVLFALMTIVALEQERSCPLPFFPDLCFETYTLFSFFKVNASPLAQLIFMQVVIPRVSFVGHLAGIVCGFILHWNLLIPNLELLGVHIVIPTILLLGRNKKVKLLFQKYIRGSSSTTNNIDDGDDSNVYDTSGSNTSFGSNNLANDGNLQNKRELTIQKNTARTDRIYHALIVITIFSIPFLDWSLAYSQLISLFLFRNVFYFTNTNSNGSSTRKYYILSTCMLLMNDGMTLGSWMANSGIVFPKQYAPLISLSSHSFLSSIVHLCSCNYNSALILMVLRSTINNICCALVSSQLLSPSSSSDSNSMESIVFNKTLGYPVRCWNNISEQCIYWKVPEYNAFQGNGFALGSVYS